MKKIISLIGIAASTMPVVAASASLALAAGNPVLDAESNADAANQPAQQNRPNILFILSDDHTSQAWGVYGGVLEQYVRNDNIRRLAKEGCVLDNCFCTNSISAPSRATILTGAYSHVNGLYTLSDTFDASQDNIAKQMQAGGYQTALVGKWHLKAQPQGFDYYSIFYDQGEYRDPTIISSDEPWPGDRNFGTRTRGFSTDIVTGKAIKWMKNADKSKPFMMCCHFKATHEPWDYPERMKHLYDDVVFPEPENLYQWGPESTGRTFQGQPLEEMARRWMHASEDPDQWWCRYPGLPFSTKGLHRTAARSKAYQKMIKDYLRCGATIDDNIGKLLDALDEMGIAENTIVVYVSDQGYFLGEHGFFDKRMMLEPSLRMPFVIRYPKEIPAGTRNKDIIMNIDFAAMLADYAGVKAPEKSQGQSFRSNLKGETPKDWRKNMYYRYWTHHDIRPAHLGIRNERYKLMFLYGDRLNMTGSANTTTTPAWEFYDLQADPHENHNAYNDPQYAKIIKQMKKELLELRKEYKDEDLNSPKMKEIMDKYYW